MKHLIFLALTIFPLMAVADTNPNEADMKALLQKNKLQVEALIQKDQDGSEVEIHTSDIRCLGLEFPASPVGVCLVQGAYKDGSVLFMYSVTIAMPAETSEDSDLVLSVKLIEAAPL